MRDKVAIICIRCPKAGFLDPKKEVCYKTGGLYRGVIKTVVGKYDGCRVKRKKPRRRSASQ